MAIKAENTALSREVALKFLVGEHLYGAPVRCSRTVLPARGGSGRAVTCPGAVGKALPYQSITKHWRLSHGLRGSALQHGPPEPKFHTGVRNRPIGKSI